MVPSRADPLVRLLSGALGGPLGRRAHRDPAREVRRASAVAAALALVTTAAGWLLKSPCRDGWGAPGQPRGLEYTHLCYSDVLPLYGAERLSEGAVPYLDHPVEYPVLLGGLMHLVALTARAASAGADAVGAAYAPATAFFDLFALVLALCAALAAVLLVRLAGPARPWDAVPFAVAPALALHAATNWDLLAVAAAVAGLVAWQRRAPLVAGVLLGVATCLKAWPVLLLGVLALLTTRAGRDATRALTRATAGWLATCLAVYVPAYLLAPRFDSSGPGAPVQTAPSPVDALGGGVAPLQALAPRAGVGADGEPGVSAVLRVVELNAERPADWDSLWHASGDQGLGVLDLPRLVSETSRGSGEPGRVLPDVVGRVLPDLGADTALSLLIAGLSALVVAAVVVLVRRAPETPRVPQVAFLVLVGLLLVGKVFSPQFTLWLLPFAVLALPRWRPLAVWQAAEVAVWTSREWFFADMTEDVRGVPQELFITSVLVRDAVLVWLVVLVVRDVLRPARDPVRLAHGGVDPAAGPLGDVEPPGADDHGDPPARRRDRVPVAASVTLLALAAAVVGSALLPGRPASAVEPGARPGVAPPGQVDGEPEPGASVLAPTGGGEPVRTGRLPGADPEPQRRGAAAAVALVGVVGVGTAVARVAVADARAAEAPAPRQRLPRP